MNKKAISEYMREMGRKGGSKTSERKKEQCRLNGLKNSPKYRGGK